MTASIQLRREPDVQYLLRIADTLLILAQRLGEWCGHAPVLEEDIALANMALDLLGQARALLARAGQIEGRGHDEDQLAFLRDERDYFNLTLSELPRGDFAFTVLRNLFLACWAHALWAALAASRDDEVAAIAAKAVKEARYHREHAADWVVRLADGTAESRRRTEAALAETWRYTAEFFEDDTADEMARVAGLGPRRVDLREAWFADIGQVFDAAGLALPGDTGFRSTGTRGIHSEHMGRLLAEMQHLQRAYPGGRVVTTASRVESAWAVLSTVLDPEVPAVSVRDLGIVRDVHLHDDGLEIVLTPTYSGCPATEVIEHDVLAAIEQAGLGPARVTLRRAPAWTTDWISAEGRARLSAYGIAPPSPVRDDAAVPMRFFGRPRAAALACPRCDSRDTERLAAFGSTACKAVHRCLACGEPFEHFKPL